MRFQPTIDYHSLMWSLVGLTFCLLGSKLWSILERRSPARWMLIEPIGNLSPPPARQKLSLTTLSTCLNWTTLLFTATTSFSLDTLPRSAILGPFLGMTNSTRRSELSNRAPVLGQIYEVSSWRWTARPRPTRALMPSPGWAPQTWLPLWTSTSLRVGRTQAIAWRRRSTRRSSSFFRDWSCWKQDLTCVQDNNTAPCSSFSWQEDYWIATQQQRRCQPEETHNEWWKIFAHI